MWYCFSVKLKWTLYFLKSVDWGKFKEPLIDHHGSRRLAAARFGVKFVGGKGAAYTPLFLSLRLHLPCSSVRLRYTVTEPALCNVLYAGSMVLYSFWG